MKKKKVAFVIHQLSGGGAERVVVRLLRGLDREKFLPVLIVLEKKGVFLEDVPEDVLVLSCGRFAEGGRLAWARNFVRHLRRERPDAIIGFLWFINGIAVVLRAAARTSSRLLVSERATVVGSGEGKLVELVRKVVIKFLYPAADRIVPNSRALARQLVERIGIPPKKVVVIPNPVDIEEIAARGTEEAAHGEAGREALPVVAGMGRLTRQKGFDLLIRAAAEIRAPCRVVVMGEGPEERRLRDLAARLNVSDRICFTGFLRNPYALLARAEVFVLPSRYEGFPNGLVEAMALGLPCVAARCPTGPEEIITDGADGLLIPMEDHRALAAAIDRLLEDPALRERLGRAARERVRAYDAPGIVRRFEHLIEEVTG